MDGNAFRYRLLGPLEVTTSSGILVSLGGNRQELVLAALLLNANQVVSVDRLRRHVWDRPPSTARNQIHMAVSRLRNAFSKFGAWNVIVTQAPGYALRLNQHAVVDAEVFSESVARGRELADRGLLTEAVGELRAGLGYWRGEMLEGLDGPLLKTKTAAYAERRLCAIEFVMDLELKRGRHREIIEDLIEVTTAHPLRERLHSQLVMALSQAGRYSEALIAYCRIHNRLMTELGLSPGPDLLAAEQTVLNNNRTYNRWGRYSSIPPAGRASTR